MYKYKYELYICCLLNNNNNNNNITDLVPFV